MCPMLTTRRLDAVTSRQVETAIRNAEQNTSGEIVVVVLNYCWTDIHDKARFLFLRHGLHKTQERNAVMILLVAVDREFLVYGDQGINEKVEVDFWLKVRDLMQQGFRTGGIVEGLCNGIACIGQQLAIHFPNQSNDNELPDGVIHDC